jgi:uncharacterized lipoprotein
VSKWVCIVLFGFFLSACSVPFASNQSDAYLKSHNSPALVTPAPLQQDEISSFYILPEALGDKKVKMEP